MKNASLLPYLQPDRHPLFLRIALPSEDPSIIEQTKFPFRLITDSYPLARFMEAKFVTDADMEVKKLFLLIQKDYYSLSQNNSWAMNNHDVENAWQRAFFFYNAERQRRSFTVLSIQIDEKGKYQPLQSLLFCKTRKLFFHPVCPHCGVPVQQCYEDQILRASGLQPYSSSLKRYLYCPSCFLSDGTSDFYTYELDPFDPPLLKDRLALIRELGQLRKNQSQEDPLPCLGCPKHGECFGPDCLALSRITCFSFYPFFMFIFDATSNLNSMDFLSLVSGGTFAEIEAQLQTRQELGRIRCLKLIQQDFGEKTPNFFEHGEGYFGEILYLKLSFLEELIRVISSRGGLGAHPDLRLDIDRIWVRLANPGSLLPFFWNFQVDLIEVGGIFQEPSALLNVTKTKCIYFLGCLWFYALLVNKEQNITQVHQFLGKVLEPLRTNTDFTFTSKENTFPAFLPQNIFWDPKGKKVEKTWYTLWEKALTMGSSLIKSSLAAESQWPEEDFLRQLNELRKEIKEALFMAKPVEKKQEVSSENEAIFRILTNIIKRWQEQGTLAKETITDTVILPLGEAEKEVTFKKEVVETVILSPRGVKEGSPIKEELTKTVILSSESLKRESLKYSSLDIQKIGDTTETVVISPQAPRPSSSFPRFVGKDHGTSREKDSLRGGGKITKEKAPKDAEEDFLSETIALNTKMIRDKKEKKN